MDAHAIRAHDLLWPTGRDGLRIDGPWPQWADADWLRRAPLVVRRESMPNAWLPVGLRGATRSQRCKAYLAPGAVARRITPDMLAARADGPGGFPALDALAALRAGFDATGLAWGPTGGVGFALASGLQVLRQDSDLDLLVRAPERLDLEQRAALLALQDCAICRVDIQIDTGRGAFALAEWARGARRVMLKTGDGPFLTDDPWLAGTAP